MKRLTAASAILFLLACGDGDERLFSGTVEIDQVRVSSRVGGYVDEVLIREGDKVSSGELLVRLDDTPFTISVNQSRAALEGARASLETLQQGARSQEISSANSAVQEARALMNQRRTDLQRIRELADAGAVSDQELQAAETAAVQAESRYQSASEALSLLSEGARSTEIRRAEAAVESAEDAVEMAEKQLEWTSIYAQLTGTVTGREVLPGENVQAGMTLLTLASVDTVKVIFYLPETMLGSTSVGDSVTVTSDSGNLARGWITYISDQAEFTPSTVETRDGRTSLVYRTESRIPNPGESFKSGMPVDVRLEDN